MTTLSESPAQNKAADGPVKPWAILLLSAFVLAVLAWFKFQGTKQTYEDQRAELRLSKLKALRAEESQTLSNYAWASKEKGLARIPIDRAMELVAAELKNATVAPSQVKVENPYPAGLATQPAPAPEATK